MNPNNPEVVVSKTYVHKIFCTPTAFSKITAAVFFIALPFLGFYIGLQSSSVPVQSVVPIVTPDIVSRDTVIVNNDIATETTVPGKNIVNTYPFSQAEFTSLDGKTAKRGMVVRESAFKYQGQSGSVKEVCDYGRIVQTLGMKNACFGNSSLVLSWQNNEQEISSHTANTLEEVSSLARVAFTEGKFTEATSSSKMTATLVVYEDPEDCISADGMCGSFIVGTRAISFPYSGVDSVTKTLIKAFPNELFWNAAGTKAVRSLQCFEGCPEDVFIGLAAGSDSTTVLLTEDEAKDRFKYAQNSYKDIEWLDNERVRIDSKVVTF